MVWAIITGIVFGAALIAGIVLAIVGFINENPALGWTGGALILVMFFLVLCIPGSFHQVETGEVAVVKHLGKAVETKGAGISFKFWMTDQYVKYDAKVQNLEISTQAYSKDAQTMDIQMTVQYQIRTDKAIDIATKYGTLDILENRITSVSVEKTKSTLSQYSAMTIIETRADVSPEVEQVIKDAIDENYYVDIVAVVLTNIDFSDTFEKVVEDKMVAEQEKLKAEYEKQKAIIEAEKDLAVAKLQAEAAIAKAKGDADAQKVIADAEAYATQIKIVELARAMGYTVEQTAVYEWQDKLGTDGKPELKEDGTPEQEYVKVGVQYTIKWNEETKDEEGNIKVDPGKELIMDYLKYLEYLSAWNGELPDVVAGEDLSMIIPNYSK